MTDITLSKAAGPLTPATRLPTLLAECGALIRLALPIMGIALVNMGMSITDTVMVSAGFGAKALAAVAVGSDVQSLLFYLSAGIIGGLSPFYTAAVFRADPAARIRLERSGQLVMVALAVTGVPLVWTAPDWLRHVGLDSALLEAGRGYTRAMALTLIPMLGVMLYRTILTAAERPGVFLKVTIVMLPLNALGNQILMYGAGPIPAFGPTGAGLSSLLVALASLAVLVLVARNSAGVLTPRAMDIGLIRQDIAAVLRVGLPIGIATVAELGIFLGATLYAATLGAADVAAHTITLRMAGVTYAVTAALTQAAMVRAARAETSQCAAARRRVTQAAFALSLIAGGGVCLGLLMISRPLAAWIFATDPMAATAISLTLGTFALLAATESVANPGSVAAGLLRGRKDTHVPMVITLSGYWVIGAPLGLWLAERAALGITGIWIGLAIGTAAMSALMIRRACLQGPPVSPSDHV